MDKQKKQRLDYKQKWRSARKLLEEIRARADQESSDSEDESSSIGCVDSAVNTADVNSDIMESDIETPGPVNSSDSIAVHNNDISDSIAVHNNDISDISMCISAWDHIEQFHYLSSDSESESEVSSAESLDYELSDWINKFQIKHNAADSLLKILQRHGHSSLPATTRTLLGSKTEVNTTMKSGMDYIYFDLKAELLKHFLDYPVEYRNTVENLEVSLNIDGLPLFTSSKTTVWPILCGLLLEPLTIFPVAILCGESKPANLDFLQDTITDLNNLIQNGLECDNRIVSITVKCIICDAPARAMVKNVKLYSGFYGCERCSQKGNWHGRMSYQECHDIQLRTDTSFRNFEQEEHHHENSPFSDLPIDMISTFSVDYMHLVCLGVMRRLLLLWIRGPKAVKLSAGQVEEIIRKLLDLKANIPNVFARKTRGLDIIDRWKATELRQFLLYSGKLALKGILRRDLYDHFMVLSVALCILVCPQRAVIHNNYANELLVYFVEKGRNLYGREFLVYNVHGLIHISTDAAKHGCLDSCSAFPFENYLHKLKRLVRSGRNPLVQMVKRLSELDKVKKFAQASSD